MAGPGILLPNPPGVADPDANRASELIAWSITMFVLSGIAVPLRFVSLRLVRKGRAPYHLADWLALAALPFAWIVNAIVIYGAVHNGYGKHVGSLTLDQLQGFLRGNWVFSIMYCWALTLARLSLIALWYRVFAHFAFPHIALVSIGVLSILWLVAASLTVVFTCLPVSGFWNILEPSHCIVQSKSWIGAAVPSTVIDIVLLILPLSWIRQLKVKKSQKIALVFIFMLGIFVTICSVLRLWQLILRKDEIAADATFAAVPTGIWSMVEVNLAVVCACLPTMRPLLRLILHGRLRTRTDQYKYGPSRSPGPQVPLEIMTNTKIHRHWSDADFDDTPLVSPNRPNRTSLVRPPPLARQASGRQAASSTYLNPGSVRGNPVQPTCSTVVYTGDRHPSELTTKPSWLDNDKDYPAPSSDNGHKTEKSWLQITDSRPVSKYGARSDYSFQ